MPRLNTRSCTGIVLLTLMAGFGCRTQTRSEPPDANLPARIETYTNTGCLSDPEPVDDLENAPDDYPGCGQDEVDLTVSGSTLNVVHRNATYTCCPDEIRVTMSADGSTISLTEAEMVTLECDCLCCFNVQATVVDLPSGQYDVELCWTDYENGGQQCHTETVAVP
jgi:hypothetical protein